MAATAQGTQRFADDADLAEVGFGPLGRTGLTVSRLGFGTYRADDRSGVHREALTAALLAGVNLIDTATNYGDGHAEILAGRVLRELAEAGKIERDQVVLVSKAGFAQGETLRRVQERAAQGRPYPELVELGPDTRHSLHPEFLQDQLTASLERLGQDSVDVYLVHNPETFVTAGLRRDGDLDVLRRELDRRLEAAFDALEAEVDRGRISWYGVSGNGFGADPSHAEHLSVSRMVKLAESAAARRGRAHHLAVIELPLNLLESGAALRTSDGGHTALDAARAAGLAVLANRPLNAFRGDHLLRLAEPPELREAPDLADAADEVEAIEAVFAQDFAPRIQVQGGAPPPDQLFRWGSELARAHERVAGLDHWMAVQAQVIAPHVNVTLPRLVQAFGGDAAFDAWARRYTAALQRLLDAVTAAVVERTRAELRDLRSRLDAVLPGSWSRASLSRRAIGAVLSTPGVASVLVGMRAPPYVEDALGAVGLPPLAADEVRPTYEALSP